MAYNEELADKIRLAIAQQQDVEEKKMFRGMTFMVNGKMCINIAADEAMFRIDPAMHDELIETKECRPMMMKEREYKGYVLVSEEDLRKKKELDYWVKLALDFNQYAKAAKKRSK